MLMLNRVDILDHGYTILHGIYGSEVTVVNAARVSMNKRTEEMRDKDEKLIKFLIENDHWSPFRHVVLQFELYAPLMVARQHWKYIVGSDHTMDAWNESSRRYVTEEPTFYIPDSDKWRSAPENKKQGSGEPIPVYDGWKWTELLENYTQRGEELFEDALKAGICTEQARLFLPAYGMYVRYYWTCSLQSCIHFLNQRLDEHAQKEIQAYALAVEGLIAPHFPITFKMFEEVYG